MLRYPDTERFQLTLQTYICNRCVAVQITPSGGLIGFNIADDLLTKEYKEDKYTEGHVTGNNKE